MANGVASQPNEWLLGAQEQLVVAERTCARKPQKEKRVTGGFLKFGKRIDDFLLDEADLFDSQPLTPPM